jgi:hypothetical protein
MSWYGVRCILLANPGLYEERITVWNASTFDEAVGLAEEEAKEYAAQIEGQYLGFLQAYRMANDLGHSSEVFSLLRDSDLDPTEYIDRFFQTGSEHSQGIQ